LSITKWHRGQPGYLLTSDIPPQISRLTAGARGRIEHVARGSRVDTVASGNWAIDSSHKGAGAHGEKGCQGLEGEHGGLVNEEEEEAAVMMGLRRDGIDE